MKGSQSTQAQDSVGEYLVNQTKQPRRILVVDDDVDLRRLNTKVLIDSGYHVDAAEDGAVAWHILQRNSYDLMITDNKMPKMSGVELLRKLCAARICLPVILASGTFPEEPTWLRPAATLLKPYSIEGLLEVVQKVLHATGAAAQIAPFPKR